MQVHAFIVYLAELLNIKSCVYMEVLREDALGMYFLHLQIFLWCWECRQLYFFKKYKLENNISIIHKGRAASMQPVQKNETPDRENFFTLWDICSRWACAKQINKLKSCSAKAWSIQVCNYLWLSNYITLDPFYPSHSLTITLFPLVSQHHILN